MKKEVGLVAMAAALVLLPVLAVFVIADGQMPPGGKGQGRGIFQGPGNDVHNAWRQREMLVLGGPITVRARVVKEHGQTREVGGSVEIDLTILKGADKVAARTDLIGVGNKGEVLRVLRKGTRWQGKFLLVRTECGGGNTWRCNRDLVFTISSGRLNRLGEVFAGDRDEPARSFDGGYFWDIYDKFEMNGLTDHATAPAFRIALQERKGKLLVNLSRTWLRNRADFGQRMVEIETRIKGKGALRDGRGEVERLILSNAVLAEYCERKKEAAKLIGIAESYFEPGRLETFRNIISQVKPGEYPVISEKE